MFRRHRLMPQATSANSCCHPSVMIHFFPSKKGMDTILNPQRSTKIKEKNKLLGFPIVTTETMDPDCRWLVVGSPTTSEKYNRQIGWVHLPQGWGHYSQGHRGHLWTTQPAVRKESHAPNLSFDSDGNAWAVPLKSSKKWTHTVDASEFRLTSWIWKMNM